MLVFTTTLTAVLFQSLVAQEKKVLGSIAVLRMKDATMLVENRELLKDSPAKMNAALAATSMFNVPDQDAVLEALDDEGVDSDDLIDLEDYLDVGKSLKTDFIVIGSITQNMSTLRAFARVYSVADGGLEATVSSDNNVSRLHDLVEVLAHRIGREIEHPESPDSTYASFAWSQQFRFAFGRERLDLAPPVVYFVNENPPFEIAVKVSMDRLDGGFVVTNFDIYADNEPIASVGPEIQPPILLREEEVEINGHPFCFRANVKEMRGSHGRSIIGAIIELTAQSCK